MARARRLPYPEPRWQTALPPTTAGSWGPAVAELARRELGLVLDRWQRRALNRALAVDAGGRLVHRIYLLSTSRQNGKTALVRALIAWALTAQDLPLTWHVILGLAFDRRQARIPYEAVLADLAPIARRLGPAPRGGLSLTRYLGIRSGMHGHARTYDVGSREAAAAIRGLSVDVGLFDEVRTHRSPDVWSALLPTTAARPEPLVLATSSAGDDRSTLLRQLFDRGLRVIAGAEPAEGFGMTWYAAPDELAPDDPRAWAASSPAFVDGRISAETIRSELYSLSPAAFRAERLNLWVDELGDEWLPAGVWARQAAPQPARWDPPVVLGVEAVPTWRRATIVAAITLPTGDVWTGVVADLDSSEPGRPAGTIAPSELVDELARVAATWRPSGVAYSSAAAAAPHVAAWAQAQDVRTWSLTAGQLRQASELFRSELVGDRIRHADDPLLAAQARVARPSAPIEAGAWYLSIKTRGGVFDALGAAAWASWAAIAPDEPTVPPQIF